MFIRCLLFILTLDTLIVTSAWTGHTAASGCVTYQHCTYQQGVGMGGGTYEYVINAITLPMQNTDFAIDLNGDGKADNQIANIVAAFSGQGNDMQATENDAINSGNTVELIQFHTDDSRLTSDPNAHATLYAGVPTTPTLPDYSGTGVFTADQTLPPGHFAGVLNSALYTSTSPLVTTTVPASATLHLALFSSSDPITLTLHGAHMQSKVTATNLISGALQGSIPVSEVQTTLVPAIARHLMRIVQQNPTSTQAMQIEAIFDVGGCTNPDGTQAVAGDHVISPCEVSNNTLVANLLAPDVQIYDSNGKYDPNPANTHPDSLSVAIGFTAVRAEFYYLAAGLLQVGFLPVVAR